MSGPAGSSPTSKPLGCGRVVEVLFMGLLAMVAIVAIALGGGFVSLGPPAGVEPDPEFGQPEIGDISDRLFSGGSIQAHVTGDLPFNVTLPLDDIRSYANEGKAWIAFGDVMDAEIVGLVTLNEPENSVAISEGSKTALGVDAQCSWDVDVTPTLISGHVSCPQADALEAGTIVGTVAIELDFSAGSSGSGPGSTFDDGDPTPGPEDE